MHWKLVVPFLRTKQQVWIHSCIESPHHSFDVITADYNHDRSRAGTSAREWLDFLAQALRAWYQAALSRQKPVGFITAFPQTTACVGLIKRLVFSRAPIIAWCFNLGQRFEGLRGRMAAFAFSGVDLFVVYSRREIDIYGEMFAIPRERFVFIPFTEELVEPQFTEDLDHPFILSMGSANRDYRTLLAAVAELGLPTTIIAGAHATAGLEIPPNVTIKSGLSLAECLELCQRARLNVVPLDTDEVASGQVTVRHVMGFGKPVIATQSIGTEDYIDSGSNGILVPPRDPAALAHAITQLWDDPARRATMGQAARNWIDEHADIGLAPRKLLELMENIRMARPA